MGKKTFYKECNLHAVEQTFWIEFHKRSLNAEKNKKCSVRTKKPDIQKILKSFHYTQNLNVYRSPETWECKTYNPYKQKIELFRHMYCKYAVPSFMIYFFVDGYNPHGVDNQEDIELFTEWFNVISSGKSFRKASQLFLNRYEQHQFLNFKINNDDCNTCTTLNMVIWYIKSKYFGLLPRLTKCIINKERTRPFSQYINHRFYFLQETIRFFSRYNNELSVKDFEEILDFIYRGVDWRTFSYNGRTLSSIINLSNQWHKEQQALQINSSEIPYGNITWDPLIQTVWVDQRMIDSVPILIKIKELTSSKDLYNEGRRMHHCVGSYARDCHTGRIHIFSCTINDENTLTIETDRSQILQIRGKYNRLPSTNEKSIINQWAKKFNILYLNS